MSESEKPATERLVDFARAVNAIDWREILRSVVDDYNKQMRQVNAKPTT